LSRMAKARAKGRGGRQETPARARPRWLVPAVAGVLALIAVGVVAGVLLAGGSSDKEASLPPGQRVTGAAEAEALYRDIPQRGDALGEPSAPVTMVEYVDPQCPFCIQWETNGLPEVISRYVRPGKVRLQVRPIGTLGADSQRGRLALIAAGRQDKQYNLLHLFSRNAQQENTGWLNNAFIRRAAGSIPGLDLSRFEDDVKAVDVANQGGRYDQEAVADHVKVTPTILVGKAGQTLKAVELPSPSEPGAVIDAIEAALG
jgi:protein-disulfide isomerase